jgi:mono/diheme cytochrome c family protein
MKIRLFLPSLVCALLLSGCGDKPSSDEPVRKIGVGPVTSIELGEIDPAVAAAGQEIFEAKCAACHKMDKRYIGPPMAGVVSRRTPEWIMNMILNPEGMVAEDPDARQLLMEYSAPMANQNLTHEEARQILEYFRTQP